MGTAFEEITFLATSKNRVRALAALAEDAFEHHELQAELEVSQPTVSRILSDLMKRNWIVQTDRQYETTVLGDFVLKGFLNLWTTMDTEQELRSIAEWLPVEETGLDFTQLLEATVTRPSRVDPYAPLRHSIDLVRAASEVRLLTYAAVAETLRTVCNGVTTGQQSFEGIFTANAFDAIATDPDLCLHLRDLVHSDLADVRVAPDDLPCILVIADGVVLFDISDNEDNIQALIETENELARVWADSIFDAYWDDSHSVNPEDLSR